MSHYFTEPKRANFLFERALRYLWPAIKQNGLFGLLSAALNFAIILLPTSFYPFTASSWYAYASLLAFLFLWLCMFYRSYYSLAEKPIRFIETITVVGKKYAVCLATFIICFVLALVAAWIGYHIAKVFFQHVMLDSKFARIGIIFFVVPILYVSSLLFYAVSFSLIEDANPFVALAKSSLLAYRKIYSALIPVIITLCAFVIDYGILHFAYQWGHPVLYSTLLAAAVGIIGLPYLVHFCNLMFEDLKLRRKIYDKKLNKV